jgi:hypothetical protein
MRSYGPYPGPFAHPYPGPAQPYPEPRAPRDGFAAGSGRMPRTALAAGVLSLVGVIPLALLTGAAVMFGGLWGDAAVEWWLYLLPVIPLLELWGAIWLLSRRGWRLPALSLVPGVGMFVVMLGAQLTHRDGLGLGWYVLALVVPLFALALTPAPSVRRWIARRPRGRQPSRLVGQSPDQDEPNIVRTPEESAVEAGADRA